MTRLRLAACCALLAAGACAETSAPGGDPVDREAFVAAYVDLRVTALESESGVLDDETRTEVLSRTGVSAEDLKRFAQVHGADVEFMRDVWNDVEVRLDALQPDPDPPTEPGSATPPTTPGSD